MVFIALPDIDECVRSNGGCTDVCKNLIGSFYCACSTGYSLAQDGQSCVDVDECAIDSHDCSDLQICINSVGSYRCLSSNGWLPRHTVVI